MLSARQSFQAVGDLRKRRSQILKFCFPKPESFDRLRQCAKNASQCRIGRKSAEEWLGTDEVICIAAHFVERPKENAVPRKKLVSIWTGYRSDHVSVVRKILCECVRRFLGSLRGRGVNYGNDLIYSPGKGAIERSFLLAPRQ